MYDAKEEGASLDEGFTGKLQIGRKKEPRIDKHRACIAKFVGQAKSLSLEQVEVLNFIVGTMHNSLRTVVVVHF